MRTLKNIIKPVAPLLLAGALSVSCVSAKKHEASLDQNEKLRAKVEMLNNTLESYKENTEQALEQRAQVLAEKEAKMAELEALVDAQKDAVMALHQEVCSALKCFTPEELTIDVREGKLYVSLSDQLLFDSGSDQVNKRGAEAIEALAQVLSNSDLEVMVEGHTDNVPIRTAKYKDNWDLSVHRASSVTRILTDKGIDPDRVIASGRGEHKPIASNDTPEGRKLNRRTELVLAPKLDKLWELTEMPAISQK